VTAPFCRKGDEIGTVTADGAYDTRRCHIAIIDRQATAIIPIRKNGRPWKEDCPAAVARNDTLRATRHYGRAVSVRSDCPACMMEWVIVSTMDSGHLEVGDGGEERAEEAGLV